MGSREESLEKARRYAFLLLKFRLRSENELYHRLKNKRFEEPIIRETLIFLKKTGFIDDRVFARAWIVWRLKRPLGLRRIRQELRIKGVDQGIIDEETREIKKNYSEQDLVMKLTKTRLDKMKGIDPRTAKRRITAYLLRRGFSPETVEEVFGKY